LYAYLLSLGHTHALRTESLAVSASDEIVIENYNFIAGHPSSNKIIVGIGAFILKLSAFFLG
jgi:hypothetical protein